MGSRLVVVESLLSDLVERGLRLHELATREGPPVRTAPHLPAIRPDHQQRPSGIDIAQWLPATSFPVPLPS